MQLLQKFLRAILIIMIIAGMAATLEAKEVKLKITGPWEAAGRVYKVGPELLQFLGTFQGIMYIDDGKGELDAAVFVCPATQEFNASNGQTIAHGRCMVTGPDENAVFAEFTCKGDMDGCQGKFKITAGEGRFKGIQGSSDMVIRSSLGAVAVNLESGAVVHAAEGLAVWPNLVYTLP
jgi:hypothetical protein